MLYLQFWSCFWKSWAEAALITARSSEIADFSALTPASAPASPDADRLSPREKYEYLTQYGTQILCMLTVETGCTYLSRNFETITGQKCDARLGTKFFSMVHTDYRERLKELLATPFTDESPHPFRCKMQHSDRKWQWYLFLIHPKKDGEAGEFVCIVENINDHMLAQNTLQKARMEAELALRARSEFLANMSHDLRTPLNAVIGFSQIIESEMFGKIDNPHYAEYIHHIQQSGYDLLARIEDLLEIANIDAGRVTLTREDVYAGDIIRHVLDAQAHHALSAQVTLETTQAGPDLLLNVDRLKMQHILGHLVANAIRHSHEGGKISVRAERSENGQLQLYIHDTGTGMTDSKLSAIASALQEDNCWTAGDNRAIGLGLALTKEFVALHGGHVEITSCAGVGTIVHITMPKDCIRAATLARPDFLQAVGS